MGLEPRDPRRLLLTNSYAVGDIVMLTAAVRDLHAAYPGEFLTDVHTSCEELWDNNPYLTSFDGTEEGIETIECDYPLIQQSNETPYHCIHGFVDFLNARLGLRIRPTRFHGDIHLSSAEKSWYSQVHELVGGDVPFWIVVSGGKYDVTVKWWARERFQAVVDHFRDRILFVQVGDLRHHHPAIDGVIDLRGQTDLRQLIRLVYHSAGVLCGVTGLMHLAAAVERPDTGGHDRPCVVVAGGREPAHWEAYPGHQYIHTNGALPCAGNGCWRSRVRPLGDGDERDRPENLCEQVVGDLPRCMDLITSSEVIRRIERYFDGGTARYLTSAEVAAARPAISDRRGAPSRVSMSMSEVVAGLGGVDRQADSAFDGAGSNSDGDGSNARFAPTGTDTETGPPGLTLVTLADASMARVAAITGRRLERYARLQGFPLVRYERLLDPGRHPAWNKILAVRHALESRQSEWVLWIDADAVVMNLEFRATRLIQPGRDLIFASDFNGLNSGVFFARRSAWTFAFMEAMYLLGDVREDPDGYGPKWEQNTIKHVSKHFPSVDRHVAILPPSAMNSYPEDYRAGDFIVHLGGMTNEERLARLGEMSRDGGWSGNSGCSETP